MKIESKEIMVLKVDKKEKQDHTYYVAIGIACLDDVEERGQETQKKPEIKMAKVNKDEQEK